MGILRLPGPVYHPLFFPFLYTLLRSKCFCCHEFRAPRSTARMLRVQLLLLDCGDAPRALRFHTEVQAEGRPTSDDEPTASRVDRQTRLIESVESRCVARLASAARKAHRAAGLASSARADGTSSPLVAKRFYAAPLAGARSPHVRQARAQLVSDFLKSQPDKCGNCGAPHVRLRKDGTSRIFLRPLPPKAAAVMQRLGLGFETAVHDDGETGSTPASGPDGTSAALALFPELATGVPAAEGAGDRLLAPTEVRAQVAALWRRQTSLCGDIWSPTVSPRLARHPTGWEACFLDALPVAPNRFRPPTVLGELKFEHPQTTVLAKVVGLAQRYRILQQGRDPTEEARAAIDRQRRAEQDTRKKQRAVAKGRAAAASSSSEEAKEGEEAKEAEGEEPAGALAGDLDEDVEDEDEEDEDAIEDEEQVGGTTVAATRGPVDMGRLLQTWQQMTEAIQGYMDSNRARERDAPAGLRQLLEKKEGLFRKHMMGKRVNFAARSVISPDPFIRTDQIGVPVRFARRLSFPQAVASFNAAHLAALVENGPDVYPGALAVEGAGGRILDLAVMSPEQRRAIARTLTAPEEADAAAAAASSVALLADGSAPPRGPARPKRVYRHLLDGDMVLMNRQPTLHKPSIMAHRVRVLRSAAQQTLRMHYANCKTYNADFDGDEMNMHLPQDHLARAEAAEIASTPHQYVVPTTGQPIRGLIQDHVAVGTLLTRRDCLLDRDTYTQLVWEAVAALPGVGETGTTAAAPPGADAADAGLRQQTAATAAVSGADAAARIHGYRPGAPTRDVPMPQPAILLPRKRGGARLWTGKQVVSTLFTALLGPSANFSVTAKAKLGARSWCARGFSPLKGVPGDERVVVRRSELCTGVLDKASLGNASYGVVHCVYELYGPQAAASLLSALGRLLTAMLRRSSISCGLADLVLTPEADRARVARIRRTYHEGARASAAFAAAGDSLGPDGEEAALAAAAAPGPSWLSPPSLSLSATRTARVALRDRLRGGEARDPSAANRLGAELDGAAKSAVARGHGEAIRTCLPDGLQRSFPTNFFSLMVDSGAKGSLVNHAMIACGLGQQVLEGRRVPSMVSGRTLPSFPPYDPSPRAGGYVADRFLTGLRPQEYYFHCMSGREGLVDTAVKTSRSGYLQRCLVKHLEELTVGYDHSVRDSEGCVVQFLYGEDGIDVTRCAFLGGTDSQLGALANNCDALSAKLVRPGEVQPEADIAAKADSDRCNDLALAATRARADAASLAADAAARRRRRDAGDAAAQPLPADVVRAYAAATAACISPGAVVEVLRPSISAEDPAGVTWRGPAEASGVWVRARIVKVRLHKRDPFAPTEAQDPAAAAAAAAAARVSGLLDLHMPPTNPSALAASDLAHLSKHGGVFLAKKVALVDPWRGPVVRPVVDDPKLSFASPSTTPGLVSERMHSRVADFVRADAQGLFAESGGTTAAGVTGAAFTALVQRKVQRALADPGEPVGVLAAQSVGEPSTQMTLNTFHLAGGGGVNVTLGIPRLREIVMTASQSIKTPAMTLPLLGAAGLPGGAAGPAAEKAARELAARLDMVTLGALLDVGRKDGGVLVRERLRPELVADWAPGSDRPVPPGSSWVREYSVRLVLAPPAAIRKEFGLSFDEVAAAAGRQFVPSLLGAIARDLRRAGEGAGLAEARRLSKSSAKKGPAEDGGAPSSGAGARAGAAARAGHEEADEDAEEDAAEEEEQADDGTLKVGRRSEMEGYEDDDEDGEGEADDEDEADQSEDDDDEDDGSGKQGAAGKGGDDSSDDDGHAAAAGRGAVSAASGAVRGAAAAAPVVARRVGGDLGLSFAVPDSVEGNPRFVSLRGSPSRGVLEVKLAFPAPARKVLMLGAAEAAARDAVVRRTAGVNRAVAAKARLAEGEPEEWTVQTEGVNLQAAFTHAAGHPAWSDAAAWAVEDGTAAAAAASGAFDGPRVRTNDIGAILHTYGVEACRAAVVREVKAVFGVYGIAVDPRHLGLIADYMTHEGGYRALNRLGMGSGASPLLKASFEMTGKFLTDAAMLGQTDDMRGASARIITGTVVRGGTGAFSLHSQVRL